MLKRRSFAKFRVVASLALIAGSGLLINHTLTARDDATGKTGAEVILTVSGEVEQRLELKRADLAAMPRRKVTVMEHDAKPVEFEGVPLHEILRKAGAALGDRLRGESVSLVVLVGAPDGYRASFGMAELDPAFTDHEAILADRRNGMPLEEAQGPLRLIVPHEKRHARWVRSVDSITVILPQVSK